MAVFARRVAHLVEVERVLDPDGTTVIYSVTGELFFASDQELIDAFDFAGDPPTCIIDLSRAHLWDASAGRRPGRDRGAITRATTSSRRDHRA